MKITRPLILATTAAALAFAPVGVTHATVPPDGGARSLDFFLHQYAGAGAGAGTVTIDPAATVSPDGSYAVRFPDAPTPAVQNAPLPGGGSVEVQLLQLNTDDALYQTAYAEYPAGTITSHEIEINSFMTSAQATLVSSDPIERGGRAGRVFVGDQGSGQATVVGLVFIDGQELWLAAIARSGAVSPDDPSMTEFLDSFQFTEGS